MTDRKNKPVALRERKKAQPLAKIYFSEAEKQTIIDTVAKDLTVPERNIFFYQCQALGLNPLLGEICVIVYKSKTGGRQMSIQVMRDGFLTIAHRSGKFAGIESGVKEDEKGSLVGWAKVYHRDFKQPVYQEADFEEYNVPEKGGKYTLWKTKPKTMIKKVAESMALRKAFNVSGVYAPEEMDLEIVRETINNQPVQIEGGDRPATPEQLKTIRVLDPKKQTKNTTKQEAANMIKELAQNKK